MEYKTEREIASGMYFRDPPERAKDFIKLKMSILMEQFVPFIKAKAAANEEWLNIDIRITKEGKLVGFVDEWKAPQQSSQHIPPVADDDIPW